MSNVANPPLVGEGATMYMWTDRHAYTVTRVSPDGKGAWMQRDTAVYAEPRLPGHYPVSYTPNPDAPSERVRLLKDGVWRCNGAPVRFGVRDAYYDPHF